MPDSPPADVLRRESDDLSVGAKRIQLNAATSSTYIFAAALVAVLTTDAEAPGLAQLVEVSISLDCHACTVVLSGSRP
jgi:hypothetical protein